MGRACINGMENWCPWCIILWTEFLETERKGEGWVSRELEKEVEAHSMVPAVLERNEIKGKLEEGLFLLCMLRF